jgi:hypothetical protein
MAARDELLQAAGSTTGAGTAIDLEGKQTNVTVYLIATGTISAGSIQVETAYIPSYSGSWAPFGSAVAGTTISGGKVAIVQGNGPIRAIRANIASTLTGGGSVEAHVVACD